MSIAAESYTEWRLSRQSAPPTDGRAAAPVGRSAPANAGREDLTAPGLPGGPGGASLVRQAWLGMLTPHFADNESCYFTGTYSDDYGYPHGLMLARNVQADFRRFMRSFDFTRDFICGVEPHRERSILHLHAILQGPFSESWREGLKLRWECRRGWSKAKPVLDGCEEYVTKYALKEDVMSFDWRLR